MVGQQQQKPNTDNFPPPQTSYKFEAIFTVVIVISVLSGAYIYRRIKLRQAQQNPHTIETGDDYEIDGIIERQSRSKFLSYLCCEKFIYLKIFNYLIFK